jgi:hypothetical protein
VCIAQPSLPMVCVMAGVIVDTVLWQHIGEDVALAGRQVVRHQAWRSRVSPPLSCLLLTSLSGCCCVTACIASYLNAKKLKKKGKRPATDQVGAAAAAAAAAAASRAGCHRCLNYCMLLLRSWAAVPGEVTLAAERSSTLLIELCRTTAVQSGPSDSAIEHDGVSLSAPSALQQMPAS